MVNRTLKYGGKSGILPKVRPIFKKNPIRPLTEEEKLKEDSVEQGYAEGVPLPKKRGFTFTRKLEPKPVITVDTRIKKTIDDRIPKSKDTSNMSQDEIWQRKVKEIRGQHLKDAYVKESQRLAKIEELKAKKAEEQRLAEADKKEYEESEATKLTLPTIESYLQGPIMRQRTETEKDLLKHTRAYNRKSRELAVKEKKAQQLLELYHQSGNFITNEEQLEKAIIEAFEIKLNKFNLAQSAVKDRFNNSRDSNIVLSENEDAILDMAHGEINKKPGLNVVKDALDGELERLRREAELAVNDY